MANSFSNVSDALTFVGRTFLKSLQSKQVLARRVNTMYFKGWSYGSTMSIPILDITGPAAVRAIGGAATASDVVSNVRTFQKQMVYKAVTLDNLQMLLSSIDFQTELGDRLAYKVGKFVDSLIAGLHTQVPYEVGGHYDGTSPWDATATSNILRPLNEALLVLGQNDADTDNLTAVWNLRERYNMSAIPNLYKVNEAGTNSLLREAYIGNIMGFENFFTSQIATAALGTTAIMSSPGAVNGNHAQAVTSIALNGLGAGTIPAGTTFTIAGDLNAEGVLNGYAITTATLIAANAATVPINPPLQNAVLTGAVVTFQEHTGTSSMNLAFHRDAIALGVQGMRSFEPGTGVAEVSVTDEQTGLSVQIATQSQLLGGAGVAYTTSISASLVAAVGVVRPEMIVKIPGQV